MAENHEWLQVDLDANHRRALADAVESNTPADGEDRTRLLRVLRSSRNELLLDESQAELVLAALNVDRQMSALRARLEAFLGRR
jgi:hypothetical protein